MEGALSPPGQTETEALGEKSLRAGYRLACQAKPMGDVKVYIPPESLTTAQRLQVEAKETVTSRLAPAVTLADLHLKPPGLHDLRADTTRLKDKLVEMGLPTARVEFPLLAGLSDQLRQHNWAVRLAIRQGEIVGILPQEGRLLGLAVDVGTTKLAGYLVDLDSGETLAQAGMMNPQIAYGEDVISRIAYVINEDDGTRAMQQTITEAIDSLAAQLCREAHADPSNIVDMVAVGNTAMHHLLAGLPVRQLGLAPYVPAVSEPLDVRAHHLDLDLAPGAYVYLPPNIAGYVGADHVAMLLASGVHEAGEPTLALDIGTNTEVTLAASSRLITCSTASGPAFEGAHIRDGMRAAPGAIERVHISGAEVQYHTIQHAPPIGICGSGILDGVAEMVRVGAIDRRGVLQEDHWSVVKRDSRYAFVLAPASATGHGRDVVVTRSDINEIQLAKAAIRAGTEILLEEAGIQADEVQKVIVAGAFGTYLDIDSAIRVGMLPDLPRHRFRQVGNAAGAGARQMLVSAESRHIAAEIAERVEYVELTVHPLFSAEFLKQMYL
jgi:uncharacterized 2Fe-2S/4Fe-4S cluster protein (DUF4445 family)